jgi:hypothetical protein
MLYDTTQSKNRIDPIFCVLCGMTSYVGSDKFTNIFLIVLIKDTSQDFSLVGRVLEKLAGFGISFVK